MVIVCLDPVRRRTQRKKSRNISSSRLLRFKSFWSIVSHRSYRSTMIFSLILIFTVVMIRSIVLALNLFAAFYLFSENIICQHHLVVVDLLLTINTPLERRKKRGVSPVHVQLVFSHSCVKMNDPSLLGFCSSIGTNPHLAFPLRAVRTQFIVMNRLVMHDDRAWKNIGPIRNE